MFRSPLAFRAVERPAGRTRYVVAGRGGVHVDENEILKGRCACSGVIMMYYVGRLSVVLFILHHFLTALLVVLQAVKSVLFGLRAEQHFCS